MRSEDEAPAAPPPGAGAGPALAEIEQALANEGGAEALIPKGNPARPKSLWWVLAALAPLAVLMACDRHFGFSVPVGIALLLVASAALLDALGSFDDQAGSAPSSGPTLRQIMPRVLEVCGALFVLLVALRLAVAGSMPWPRLSSGVLVTGSMVGVLIAVCRLAEAARVFAADGQRWFARRGFWLLLLNVLLYVPLLGSYSLS